jgi:hypothetical protein
MTCRELDRLLASHGPAALPPGVAQHAADCPHCRNLLRVVAADEPADFDSAMAAALATRLSRDLAPVRPLAPAPYLATGFAAIFAILAMAGGAWLGDRALLKMDWPMALAIFATLAVSAAALAIALSAQMVPASRPFVRPAVLAPVILLALAIVFAALFAYDQEGAFWLHAWRCLRTGLEAAALASALFWLILRRGAILDPAATGALAGLLGGLTGATMLEIHCPNFNLAHILIGHWAVPLLFAAAGWAFGRKLAQPQVE